MDHDGYEHGGLAPPAWYAKTLWTAMLAGLLLISTIALLFSAGFYDWTWVLGAAVPVAAVLAMRIGRGRWVLARPAWQWLLAILLLAAALRVTLVLAAPYRPCADFDVYHRAGVHMAETWTLGVPACADTARPSYRCFYPPGQVFALGVMYRLFGTHVWAGQLLNVVWMLISIVGVWYLGCSLFGEWAGRAAALVVALLPSTIFGCLLLGAETPETPWLIGAMCLYVGPMQRSRGRRVWLAALLCGLLLGVGSLIRPTYVLLPVVMGLHMLLSRPGRKRAIALAVLVALGTAAVVLPWTWRNYRVTGGFILISSNGGGNLWSANNPQARGDYTEATWVYLFENAEDDLSLQRLGKQKAWKWIRRHPRWFARLAVQKFVLFWYSDKEIAWWALEQPHIEHPELGVPPRMRELGESISSGFYAMCLILAAVSLAQDRRAWWRDRRWMVIAVFCAYFTAVHMVFEAQGKYHFMLVPILCVLSVAGWSPKWRETSERKIAESTPK